MNVTRDWLWDRKITLGNAKAILRDPPHSRFLYLSALLLSRKNTPREVFKHYLKPIVFARNWPRIKRQMRKDKWNEPRIEYWQAIYEALKEKFRKKGIDFREGAPAPPKKEDDFCKSIADRIKILRKQKGLTQCELARKLGVSQQMVSRIERGRENISLLTLKNIVGALDAEARIEII